MSLRLDAITMLVLDPQATKNNPKKEMLVSIPLFRIGMKGPAEILPVSGMVCPEPRSRMNQAGGNGGIWALKIRCLLLGEEIRLQSVCHRIMRNVGV